MISRNGKDNFFAAHYDWLVAGVGVLALAAAAVFYVMTLGVDADEMAAAEGRSIDRLRPAELGVKPLDMTDYQVAMRLTKSPVALAEIDGKAESFLASERRVFCANEKCKKAIPGDVKRCPKCPYCGEKQAEEQMVALDADQDGLPDEWERKFGLNPTSAADADADKDGDGFTNMEEFTAKTDPTDPKDHPPYLDSLKVIPPAKQTYLPFVFTKATQVPNGWRCEFFDAAKKDLKRGNTGYITAKIGEEVPGYGYVIEKYEQKSEKRERKGMKGMMISVDVSEVTLKRTSDGKVVKAVIGNVKTAKPAPVDVQVTLAYERGETKNFEVVPGTEIDLNGEKHRVVDIETVGKEGKGVKVTLENSLTRKKHVLEALEQ